MKAIVFYATREGQARRVAERIGTDLRAHFITTDVVDVKAIRGGIDWPAYRFAFVVASVHAGGSPESSARKMCGVRSRTAMPVGRSKSIRYRSLLSYTLACFRGAGSWARSRRSTIL